MTDDIERIELYPVRLRYKKPISWASVREEAADYLLLKISTNGGLTGLSEGTVKPTWTGATLRTLTAVIEDLFLPRLRGVTPFDPGRIQQVLRRVPGHDLAKAMIDAACWDLVSQRAQKPLWMLWNGHQEVPVSGSVTRQPQEKMVREAAWMVETYGFSALKLKGGQGPEADFANIASIGKAVGEKVRLYVDTNGAYTAREAPAYVARLADLGVSMVEDPCRLQPDEAFRNLQENCPLPIIVDAGCNDLLMTGLFLKQGARSFVLKMGKTGFTENRAIAELASGAGREVHVGVLGGSSFGSLAALQLAASLPPRKHALPAEATFFLQLAEEYLEEPLQIRHGCIRLPDSAGLGRSVDWDKVERLQAF